MVRDPRDRHEAVLAGRAPRPGEVGRSTALWLRSVKLGRRYAERYPGAYTLVRYESLVSRPEDTMRHVCEVVGEPYEDAMLLMSCARRYDAFRADGSTIPLTTMYVGRYHGRVDLHDVAFIQSVAGLEMRALDYARDEIRLTGPTRLRFMAGWPINVASMSATRTPQRPAVAAAS
jgi:hypothetical protein